MVQLKPVGERCPDCEGYLVERINSNTKNTFIGCSEWPDCTYTRRGGDNPALVKKETTSCQWDNWDDPFDDYDYEDSYYGGFFSGWNDGEF